jgi:hypothetical protein
MHDHARRLVYDRQMLVLIKDIQRNILRARGLAGDFRKNNPNSLPGYQPIRRLSSSPVDAHPARRNHPAQMHPAVVGEMMGKKNIQPPTSLRGINNKLDWFL